MSKKSTQKWFKDNTHYIKVDMLLIGRVSCCQKRWLMQDDGLLPMPKKYPPIIIYGFSILYGIKVPSSESSKIPREIHLFQRYWTFNCTRFLDFANSARTSALNSMLRSTSKLHYVTLWYTSYIWMDFIVQYLFNKKCTLPKTNIAPKNGWFPIGISFSRGSFSGAMLVSGRVSSNSYRFVF